MERFHDYHAVTSDDYAQGLISSGDGSIQSSTFNFLLGEADQDELNAVKKNEGYRYSSNEFKESD